MIPVVRQIPAPMANAGTAMGVAEEGPTESDGFNLDTSEDRVIGSGDALLMGGFAIGFVAQDLPKATDPKSGADAAESHDTSSAGLVDLAAIIELPSGTLTADGGASLKDAALDPELVADVDFMQASGAKNDVLADLQKDALRPDLVQSAPVAPMMPSMAESMFQTQIDAGNMLVTGSIAATATLLRKPSTVFQGDPQLENDNASGKISESPLETATNIVVDSDGSMPSFGDHTTDLASKDSDVVPSGSVLSLPDLVQNLTSDLAAESQRLQAKTDIAPLQSTAQIPASIPNLPTTAPQLAAQILPHSNAAKIGPIEVLLNPAELGHLRFEIHQKGAHVQVVLTAERPETLEMLRRNGDQLAAEFRNAGFSGASLSFGQWGRSSDGQPPAHFFANSDDDLGFVAVPQIAKPQLAQDHSRNLNLRL